jgi:hypothetical protein
MALREECMLRGFENRTVRKILGPKNNITGMENTT